MDIESAKLIGMAIILFGIIVGLFFLFSHQSTTVYLVDNFKNITLS